MPLKTEAAKDILGYSEKIGKMNPKALEEGFEKYKSFDRLGMLSGRGFGEGIGGGFKGSVKEGAEGVREGKAGFQFDLAKVEKVDGEYMFKKNGKMLGPIPPDDIKQAMKSGYENMGKKLRSMTLTRDVEGRVTELLEVLGEGTNVEKLKKNEEALKRDIETAAKDSPIGKEKAEWNKKKIAGVLATAVGGYIVISAHFTQDPDDCYTKCLTNTNDDPTAQLTPPEGGANCKDTEDVEKCKKFCSRTDGACSRENCITRSQKWVRKNPGSAIVGTGADWFNDASNVWYYAKYFVFGFAVLLGLFLIYKFTSSYATGKAAKYTMSGLISGVGERATEMSQKYATAQKITNAVKPS